MLIVRSVINGVKGHLKHRFAEWSFTAALGAFGLILYPAGETFAVSHSYDFMARVMTEEHWCAALLTIVLLRLVALTLNGSFGWFRPYSPAIRCLTAWLSAGAWTCLAVGIYIANERSTGWGTYGVLAFSDAFLAHIIAGEAGPLLLRRFFHARSR